MPGHYGSTDLSHGVRSWPSDVPVSLDAAHAARDVAPSGNPERAMTPLVRRRGTGLRTRSPAHRRAGDVRARRRNHPAPRTAATVSTTWRVRSLWCAGSVRQRPHWTGLLASTCRLSGGPRRPTVDATTDSIVMGQWEDRPGTGDWWGRALWGARHGSGQGPSSSIRAAAARGFDLGIVLRSPFLHPMAFAALGAAEVLAVRPRHDGALRLLSDFAAQAGPAPHRQRLALADARPDLCQRRDRRSRDRRRCRPRRPTRPGQRSRVAGLVAGR